MTRILVAYSKHYRQKMSTIFVLYAQFGFYYENIFSLVLIKNIIFTTMLSYYVNFQQNIFLNLLLGFNEPRYFRICLIKLN
jgi:hypothetical protein